MLLLKLWKKDGSWETIQYPPKKNKKIRRICWVGISSRSTHIQRVVRTDDVQKNSSLHNFLKKRFEYNESVQIKFFNELNGD